MSSNRVEKRDRSSTQRRRDAISRIEKIGKQLFDMGRCTPCQRSDSFCFVLEGHSKCSSCAKKGVKNCDGNFSVVEFDTLEHKKLEVQQRQRDKRAEVGRRAAAVASAYAALVLAQREEQQLEDEANKFSEAQSRMLRQELQALDALDDVTEFEPQVGVLSDDGPVWDDPAMLALFQENSGYGFDGILGQMTR